MKKDQSIKSQALLDNEIKANLALSYGCVFTAFVLFVAWMLILTGLFKIKSLNFININFPVLIVLLVIPFALSFTKLVKRPFFKYAVLVIFTIIVAAVNVAIPKHAIIAWAACIVIASHYYSPRTVVVTFISTAVMMAVSIPLAMLYGEWDANLMGVTDEVFMQFSTLFPDKPLPHGGTDPYDVTDRIYFLNHYNDYYISTNRWIAVYAYYYSARFVCLLLVFALSLQLNQRSKNILYREIKAQEEKGKLTAELSVASDIQLSALPREFPENEMFDIYAVTDPAKEVGGDFYNAFIHKDKLFFLIGDVSGKGVPAALFMMKTVTLICSIIKGDDDISNALRYTNHELCIQNDTGMFVTAIVGCLDLKTGKTSFANAGHNPPIHGSGNKFDYFKLPSGFILGGLEGSRYKQLDKTLKSGDTIFIYTDGVTEAMNENDELYGEKRLKELLDSLPETLTAKEICEAVQEDIKKFVGDVEQSDDITMLALKYNEKKDKSSFSVPADKAEVGRVVSFINEFASKHKVNDKLLRQLDVAVDEVCSNIFNYAYKDKKGIVTVDISFKDKTLKISFIDNGVKFNPLNKEDPNVNLPLEERPIGGLGIFLVKQLMDDVTYEYSPNGENILTIIKKVGD